MKSKANTHKILFALFVLVAAAWGTTACGSSTTPQQGTSQQTQQRTQQETTRQASQASQSTTSSSDLDKRFVGTWQKTSFQGNPVPQGTQVLVFSSDGTLESSSSDGSEDWTGRYKVLDDSRIQISPPNDKKTYVANYNLNGDEATIGAGDQTGTFQKTG